MLFINNNAPVESVEYGQTIIPKTRLDFLYEKCKETLINTPGNVLEVGVYKGGTLSVLAKAVQEVCPDRIVFGIDTFEGHPYSDGHPVHYVGKYNDVEIDVLTRYFLDLGLNNNIKLEQGKIEEIWPNLNIKDLSFVHIDCDLYKPIRYCCEHILRSVKPRGVIYFDDYFHEHCPGATRAIEECFAKEDINLITIIEDQTCWSGYINL